MFEHGEGLLDCFERAFVGYEGTEKGGALVEEV